VKAQMAALNDQAQELAQAATRAAQDTAKPKN
jgi:hypothetical protein